MIINKTPHPVNIVKADGTNIHTFPKAEGLIRLSVNVTKKDDLEGIPTSITEFGKPEGLPETDNCTYYIVSQLVKAALPERTDLLVPADVLRNEQGQIVGCKSLGR